MPDDQLRVAVIVGSTREGRFGDTVGRWLVAQARQRPDMALEVVDLAELGLPAVHHDEPSPAETAFTARIDAADAFVVVTPEYNHGYPASLKFAIDTCYTEFRAKPVAFVSYGGLAGGLRSVEQLRQVFAELHAVTIRDTVSFHAAARQFDPSGQPVDGAGCAAAAKVLLDRLAWFGVALREARAKRPYDG